MSEQNDHIVDDYSVRIKIQYEGEDMELLVSAKYDRIDYWPRWGNYIMKVIDPDHGFISMAVDEETAFRVQEAADLPIVPRDEIFRSEYELYLNSQERTLNDDWLK